MTNYRAVGDKHAVEQAIVGVRLRESANEAQYKDALALTVKLAEQYSLPGRVQLDPMSLLFGRQSISFGFDGAPGSEGGHLFQQVSPDGSTAQELTLESGAVTFRTMAYERWDDVANIVSEVIVPVTQALSGSDLTKVSVIEFRCIDKFINDTGTAAPLSALIRQDCELISDVLKQKSSSLHCHVGWFEEMGPDERYLYNLNVGIADGEGNQTAQILQVLSRQFRSGSPNAGQGDQMLTDAFGDLHSRDKGLLTMLLTDDLQSEINLAGNTVPVLP